MACLRINPSTLVKAHANARDEAKDLLHLPKPSGMPHTGKPRRIRIEYGNAWEMQNNLQDAFVTWADFVGRELPDFARGYNAVYAETKAERIESLLSKASIMGYTPLLEGEAYNDPICAYYVEDGAVSNYHGTGGANSLTQTQMTNLLGVPNQYYGAERTQIQTLHGNDSHHSLQPTDSQYTAEAALPLRTPPEQLLCEPPRIHGRPNQQANPSAYERNLAWFRVHQAQQATQAQLLWEAAQREWEQTIGETAGK
ncbi:hypothetical protein QFC22_000600 [Naganishia vaughanmartiniae]|uniref:Uncharacterized protein n=1 Tax=Naganishia vaughanmartiniae TaxID=1424756 RepID=A0ACC2XP51_9TREE|nr:hypothetical protein QFC22_000600 [Naganishia vaughanmartiniae]